MYTGDQCVVQISVLGVLRMKKELFGFCTQKKIVWVFNVAGIQLGFFVCRIVFLFFVLFCFGGVRVPSVFFASSLNFVCQNTVIIN